MQNLKGLKMNKLHKYPKYKNSGVEWIGEIPKHWEVRKLKYIFDYIQTGTTPSTDNVEFFQGNINWYNPKDLNNEILKNSEKKISQFAIQKGEIKMFPQNSILIVGIGATTGKTSYMISDGTFNQQITGFKSLKYNNKYLFYLMKSFSKLFLKIANYTTLPILNNDFFKNFILVIPPHDEQIQIAEYLDKKTEKIDKLISIKEKLIKRLKEQRQIIINNAVTKGLNPNVKMKDSGIEWIGKIPEHWEVRRLKFLFKIRKKIANSLGYDVLSITQTGIKIKDINSGEGQLAMDYSKYQLIFKGDFAMNHMDLLTGYIDISKYNGVISPDYRVFTIKDNNCIPEYYLRLFQMCYHEKIFYAFGQGVSQFGRWRFPSNNFYNFFVPVPPYNEQIQIAKYLDKKTAQIDKAIKLQEEQIKKLKEYKTTLIDSVVTGKVRIIK